MGKNYNVIVYHIGARDNYSVAETFQRRNNLICLITDFWKSRNIKFIKKGARRFNKNLTTNKIISYKYFQILKLLTALRFLSNKFSKWNFKGDVFEKFVVSKLSKISSSPNQNILLWGYTGGNLNVLKKFKGKKNIFLLHNQIDPGLVYYDLENSPNSNAKKKFLKKIVQEWELADVILVNSEYSKKCLIEKNVSKEKIIVVPLIYKSKNIIAKKYFNNSLTIGFVGNINQLKGFDTFLNVARNLSKKFNFVAIGKNHFSTSYHNNAKKYITFTGHLEKSQLDLYYKNMDILLFPTLCDGFGMVQLEAMSFGIPVIASSSCGNVVEDGRNGFVINEEVDIIEKLIFLDSNREILNSLSKECLNRVKDFSEENFIEKLNIGLEKFDISL